MPDDNLAKLRIAVTGFNGFIGSSFVHSLRSLSIPVIFLKGDVRSGETWKKNFDVLYHFAAMMPKTFVNSPHDAFSVNIDGVLNALEACRKNKAQMVFLSTCGVYKPNKLQPFSEGDVVEPPTAYTHSKLIGEILCRSYADQYGVKSTVLRLFNVYGPGQDLGYIIPYLVKCVLEGITAEVHHPESSRDFVYIRDVVDVLMLAVKTNEMFSVYNVGSGKNHTISEVIELIGEACEKKIQYRKVATVRDPQPNVCANVDKALNDLGWSAKMSLKDGIHQIVNDLKSGVQ